jgi:hypothetical protein
MGNIDGYTQFVNFKISNGGNDCSEDTSLNGCKTQCDYSDACVSFSLSKDKKCCLNNETSDISYDNNVNTYVKTPVGYSIEKLGDRTGGIISSDDSNFGDCIDKCSITENCMGISYKIGTCELKKKDGLSSSYSSTGKQLLINNKPKSAPPPETPHVKARYVEVENTLEVGPINLSEIEVYDVNGENVARNGSAYMSSVFNVRDFQAWQAIDGNLGTFAHTKSDQYEHAHIGVDLGKEVKITKVVIKNRQDCCKDRLNGAYIRMFDNNKTNRVSLSPPFTGSKNEWTYDPVTNFVT